MFLMLDLMAWIIILGGLAMLSSVAIDSSVLAGLSMALTLGALQLWGRVDVWGWIVQHWVQLLLGNLVYTPIGIGWSLFKWWRFLLKIKEQALEDRQRHQERGWQWEPKNPPRALDHKNRIICWISYWPASMLWALLADALEGIATAIYRRISAVYQRMSDKVFADLKK